LWSAETLAFYTGASNNPDRRLLKHNGLLRGGARFTRKGRPWKIVYVEGSMPKSDALRRERAIKKLRRQAKLDLIVNGIWNPSSSRFERLRVAKTPASS
jgi:putative endonuclease